MKTITIDKSIEEMEFTLKAVNKQLASLPDGKLLIHQRKKNPEKCWFSIITTTNCKKYFSTKQRTKLIALLKKRYLQKLQQSLCAELRALKNFEENYKPEEKYNSYNFIPQKFKNDVLPIIQDKESLISQWQNNNFPQNPCGFKENLQLYTKKGERVRSKAEAILADILTDLQIPYRYECELKINGKVYYPDFTVIRKKDLKIFYIEYFGLMDNEEYLSNTLLKMNAYNKSEFADSFIYFFESSDIPMNTLSVKNTIVKYFL